MSSSQRGPSTGHYSSHHSMGNSTHDAEATNRIRYMAHMERRARPPTFRPLTIVVVVLSIGLFVIGLIMIVIAHWPGVSAGDSLKIAGGVLMAVGGVVFIIAMIVTCVLKNREKDRFEKSIASLQASRSMLNVGSTGSLHGSRIEMTDLRSGFTGRSRASTLASLNEREGFTQAPILQQQSQQYYPDDSEYYPPEGADYQDESPQQYDDAQTKRQTYKKTRQASQQSYQSARQNSRDSQRREYKNYPEYR